MKTLSRYETYANLCQLVYAPVFNHKMYGFDSHKMIHNSRGEAFIRVLSNDKEVVILFRGTHVLLDWITNFKFLPQIHDFPFGQHDVHSGFINSLLQNIKDGSNTVISSLENELNQCMNSHKRLIFSGHSLGGALATLAAAKLSKTYAKNIDAIFTFGQPAVGFSSFKKAYPLHEKTIRINAGVDMVTFLPGPLYQHVGRQFWIHDGRVYRDVHWIKRITRSVWLTLTSIVKDHSMKKYIRHKTIIDLMLKK